MGKRFEPRFEHCIEDYNTHTTLHCDDRVTICNLLNEQDEKIKELEKDIEIWQLKAAHMLNVCKEQSAKDLRKIYGLIEKNEQLTKQYDQLNKKYCEEMDKNTILKQQLEEKTKELKQSQNQKAIEELEKMKKHFCGKRPVDDLASEVGVELGYPATQIQNYLDNQITELRGEDGKKISH